MNVLLLPVDLLNDILYRLEHKSLAKMRCMNKYLNVHISDFETEYFSRVGSSFVCTSTIYGNSIYCKPFVTLPCTSPQKEPIGFLEKGYIFGSYSGLILIYITGRLIVANPLTKKFRILDHSGSKILTEIVNDDRQLSWEHRKGEIAYTGKAMCVGFTVDRNGTSKRFKIVCILEISNGIYGFEMSDGDSWRLSETTITTRGGHEADIKTEVKPVYLNDMLHWLIKDGSIITFNLKTEQARIIPSMFHSKEHETKLLLTSDDKINRLTLISWTREKIRVYTLVENDKWGFTRQINDIVIKESWNVVAYDGKSLVVMERIEKSDGGVVHVYDMGANTWGLLGTTNRELAWSVLHFYKFTPSFSFVEENEQQHKGNVCSSTCQKGIIRLYRPISSFLKKHCYYSYSIS